MNVSSPPHPTIDDLKFEIGQVQVCWSFLEIEMRHDLAAWGLDMTAVKGPIITRWRNHMREVAAKQITKELADYIDTVERLAISRNLLVHGIQSLSADPWKEASALVVCAASDGSLHTVTIEMLRDLSREINKVRSRPGLWHIDR